MERCLRDNLSFSVKNIKEFMSVDAIDIYNRAIDSNEFQSCLEVLKLLENNLNNNSCKKDDAKKYILS